jgi:L-rhamnose mutarotase
MPKYVLACDLKNDPSLIAEYEAYHRAVWPEVLQSLKDAGILRMEIFRTGNRLTMVIDTTDDFSFERKAAMDLANPKVQAWEKIMWTFQDNLPHAPAGVKWLLMEKIFDTGESANPSIR